MRLPRTRRRRIVQASGTALLLAGLVAAGPAEVALGRVRTKTCATIKSCSSVAITPPLVTSPPPGGTPPPPTPVSRDFRVAVAPAITTSSTTTNQPAKLVFGPVAGRRLTCRGYTPRDSRPFEFKLLTATPMKITYEITDRLVNTTADGVQFCLAAPFAFKTLAGTPAQGTVLPDRTRGHIGLLPRCPRPLPPAGAAAAPCVVTITSVTDANSSTGVDVLVRVRVPTDTPGGAAVDPWGGS